MGSLRFYREKDWLVFCLKCQTVLWQNAKGFSVKWARTRIHPRVQNSNFLWKLYLTVLFSVVAEEQRERVPVGEQEAAACWESGRVEEEKQWKVREVLLGDAAGGWSWTSVEERFLATFVSSDTSGWRTSLRCDTSAWRTLGGVVVLVGPLHSAVTLQHSHLCQSQPLNWHLGQYCETLKLCQSSLASALNQPKKEETI